MHAPKFMEAIGYEGILSVLEKEKQSA